MFRNIGARLQTVAKCLCWIGMIGSVIGGILMISSGSGMRGGNPMVIPGIATMLGGALASWIGSMCLYALGEITENSDIRTNLVVKADVEREREEKPNEYTL